MTYTSVFGGGPISSSNVSYLALAPTGDVTLDWPREAASTPNLLATIIDVTATIPVTLTMPDASQGSQGAQFLFNNLGTANVTVVDHAAGGIVSVPPGQGWVVYLYDNSTEAGGWRTFQLGAFISQAQAASLAGSGSIAIGDVLAEDVPVTTFSSSGRTFSDGDRAILFRWTGGADFCTLPDSGSVPQGWFFHLRNDGSGSLIVNCSGGDMIDGSASLSLAQGDSCDIINCGAGVFATLGLTDAGGASPGFDYTSIAVAGTGNHTLTGAELNRISYKFTGLLTGDRTIIVPATVQQYWITNATTGAFNFYVKTAAQAGTGVQVVQNQATILYCNGADVVPGDTANLSFPISIAQGGTGAVDAGGARSNLGSTAVGDAVFTAATAAAARATLGAASLAGNSFSATQIITVSSLVALQLIDTDTSGTEGPTIDLFRNSASPAVNDVMARLQFNGNNSAIAKADYASIFAVILDPTAGNHGGQLVLRTAIAGAEQATLSLGPGVQVGAPAGGDKGADTLNVDTLYEAGTAISAKYIANSLMTANGDIIYRNAGVPARLAIGAAGRVLTVSGGLPAWVAPASSLSQSAYDSGDQVITSGGSLTLNHGLGGTPTNVVFLLHCVSGELGYNAGDFAVMNPGAASGANHGLAACITSTQITVRYGSDGSAFQILRKDTGASTNAANSSWRLVVRAQRVF